MKAFGIGILFLLFLLMPGYVFSATFGALHLSHLEGDVQVRTEDTVDWVAAAINMPLRPGDRLWVPEGGRLEISFRDGTQVRLDQRSSLEIVAAETDSFQLYLDQGHVYAHFSGVRGGLLQIDTPSSSIRAFDRSRYRVDVDADNRTELSVFRGAVHAESRNGKTRVSSGQTLFLRDDRFGELVSLAPPDEWEHWNVERERRLSERRYSARYLPAELEAYSPDFDNYGRWVTVREYGYVWTPTVVVSSGWAPYRTGRWVWAGGDYVWLSSEPWGWAPYHYGRWSFVATVGWCWIPPLRGSVYWGPGYVGWVHTPTHVAWVPLAPGEIYFGYGHYGPHSVNINQIHIHQTTIKNIYKNVHVHNAATVVHHDSFLRGRTAHVTVRENLFLTEKVSVGRPSITPVRETKMPGIREVPRLKQPPQQVRETRTEDIRKDRPLTKTRTESVMAHSTSVREMPISRAGGQQARDGVQSQRVFTERMKKQQRPEETVQSPSRSAQERPQVQHRAERTIAQPQRTAQERDEGKSRAERVNPQSQQRTITERHQTQQRAERNVMAPQQPAIEKQKQQTEKRAVREQKEMREQHSSGKSSNGESPVLDSRGQGAEQRAGQRGG